MPGEQHTLPTSSDNNHACQLITAAASMILNSSLCSWSSAYAQLIRQTEGDPFDRYRMPRLQRGTKDNRVPIMQLAAFPDSIDLTWCAFYCRYTTIWSHHIFMASCKPYCGVVSICGLLFRHGKTSARQIRFFIVCSSALPLSAADGSRT